MRLKWRYMAAMPHLIRRMTMKVTVGVLFGGESVEHEVSIISAVQAMEALDKKIGRAHV